MTKNKTEIVSAIFYFASGYDLLLGCLFLIFAENIYESLAIAPPNHWGYVHFPAVLLIIFGTMFFEIGRRPIENRNLMPYGMLLKTAYCGVVFAHWIFGDIPELWKPFAFADLIMLWGFAWAYRETAELARPKYAAEAGAEALAAETASAAPAVKED